MNRTQTEEIRVHWERFRAQIEETGNLLRGQNMPTLTEELFSLYEKTGNRLIYENEYFERRRFLAVFGLLSIWYRRKEDLSKLTEVIEDICREKTWALPAHVDRQTPGWERTVDLFASETGQTLSQITAYLNDVLNPELVKKVKELVTDRLLDSYMEVPRGEWRWEKMYNNWVAVCAGSLGSMALYLLDDEPEKQQKIVERVCDTMPDYLEGMYDDGTCPEGLSYFTYGMVYYTGFARQLEEKTRGKIRLMDQEKVRKIARFQQKCYFPGGKTVSFSDGSNTARFRLGLTCYLAGTVDGVEIPDVNAAMDFEDDHCYRFMGNFQDDCWVKEYLEKNHEAQTKKEWFSVLPDAQWAVWKTEEYGIAIKGGHNGEPHNHNDVGSFQVTANGEVFLTDLGCGEYTKEYFAEDTRYQLLCNRSLGHSVPLLNGEEQKTGSEYGAEVFREEEGTVFLRFAKAYGCQSILERSLKCEEDQSTFTLKDYLEDQEGACHLTENLVTQIEPSITGNKICLKGKKGTLELELSGNGTVEVKKEMFRNHRGKDEEVFLLQWLVPEKENRAECIIYGKYISHKQNKED